MKNCLKVWVTTFLLVALVGSSLHARTKRALILGIDGLRGDALQSVLNDRKAPNIQQLINQGDYAVCSKASDRSCARAHAGNNFDKDYVWKTGPGWGSVISGLDAAKHQIKNIGHQYMKVFADVTKTYSTIFMFLRKNGFKTAAAGVGAFLTSYDGKTLYPGIVDYECGAGKDGPIVSPADKSSCNLDARFSPRNEDENRDDKITDAAIDWINDPSISLVMLVLDQVDAMGHKSGFDLSPDYLRAIEDADKRVGRLLSPIDQRSKGDEDWLVILTSDHSGHNQSRLLNWIPGVNTGIHGAESGKDDIVSFIVGAFPRNAARVGTFGQRTDVRHFDTFKTIAKWFGVDDSASVRARDGRARIN